MEHMGRTEQGSQIEVNVPRSCVFCNPKESVFPHFQKYGRDRIDLAHLLETDNVVLKPDILPSSPDGHFLVIPKEHNLSFASLPHLAGEVGNMIYEAEQIIKRPLVFFEHGSIHEGSKVQSVYHQHGHLIPDGSIDMLAYMCDSLKKMNIQYDVVDTADLSPIINLQKVCKGFNYLYVQQGRVGLIAHDSKDGKSADTFPSQITQRKVSELLWHKPLDWKKISCSPELAKLSVSTIAHIVDECHFPIPS